jgi:hypothetical protein
VHKSASANEETLEFVSSGGDSVTVRLTDDERRDMLSQPAPLVLSHYLIARLSNTLEQHDIGFGVRDTLYVDAHLLLLPLVSSVEMDST